MYQVNDRIQFIDNQFATVRFVGQIPEWGEQLALGVEWDDPARGKNNGSVGGIEYFKTRQAGAGSFIKVNNKKILNKRVSFDEALLETYGVEENQIGAAIRIGSKKVESYGFEKLNKINANFSRLTSVSLDFKCIYTICKGRSLLSLTSLVKLDFSFNLINDMGDIWSALDKLRTLKELNLNGNRFEIIPKSNTIHGLEILKLSNTRIRPSDLKQSVLPKFPHLREITLASNGYTDEDDLSFNFIENVDLSFNGLTQIPSVNCLSLNLSDNKINYIYNACTFKAIDLRYNEIDSWEFVEDLQSKSRLRELRIDNNPLFEGLEEDEVTVNLIARFECVDDKSAQEEGLRKLNGSRLSREEIENAELYFISKVQKGDYICNETSERWKQLKSKHNVKDEIRGPRLNEFAYHKIRIKVYWNNELILDQMLLNTNTIMRLKGSVSRKLNKSIFSFRLYYFLTAEVKQYLDDEIGRIGDFDLHQQDIYIAIEANHVK
ncbi:hypothetical protein PSN45_002239 [Yamadazyma tenuis]|uniref:CAP-Gly domain-containing protein n=1 Tax=Candida tenuis (strain ATCC 10573 / BCRC 21748 / CBS 615 / JCM 9827 / NBRC 10315 / NRRL Y-1498 / VKM Y-70) TaxID=590646 RepID=G3BFD0_CANTC|nr:uncharacterized protein CANTEDRAFT_110740 [Yamadazyma tenuis ATCC 10573]EGV60027.1 hypothetical protein CANTEDRAFT_110740 [Yamadazyma tenuis ATCC 10573]WEJ94744.1 hypothetical protein PSN45_002239 [Yamadazyma tenuis]